MSDKDKKDKDKKSNRLFSFGGKDRDKKVKAERPKSKLTQVEENNGDEEQVNIINSLSDNEINKKFEQMLDDMNLAEGKKEPLRKMNIIQKKSMLIMQNKGSKASHGKMDNIEEFIEALNNKEVKGDQRFEIISSLRIALTNNPVSWVKEFGSKGGLKALLNSITYFFEYYISKSSKFDKSDKIEKNGTLECIKCLSKFTNNKYGLQEVIQHEEALTILARCIDVRDVHTMKETLQMMAALCLVRHEKVLDGLTINGEMKNMERFLPILQGFTVGDVPLKASCMQLINALVLTPEDLEFRVHLRNEFMRDGLMDHLESLLTTDNEELRTQVQPFIEHKENDFDELRLRLDNIAFNMQDAQQCCQVLCSSTLGTMSEYFFLSILQHLLLIRDDGSVKPLYYELIEECVSQIVLHKNGLDPDFRKTKRFDVDVESLFASSTGSDNTRSSSPSLSIRQPGSISSAKQQQQHQKLEEAITAKQEAEAKVASLEEKLKKNEVENAELKIKLSQSIKESIESSLRPSSPSQPPSENVPPIPPPLPGGPGIPSPPPLPGGPEIPIPPPLPGGPGIPPPPPLPGGPGIPPPPPLSGGPGIPPPPPFPGGPGIPPPPPFPGGAGIPPPPPLANGMAPPPPPMPGAFPGRPGLTPPGGFTGLEGTPASKKKKYNPEVQLKRANWNKLNARVVTTDSFWANVDEDKLAKDIIFEGIKLHFATKVAAPKVADVTDSDKKKKGKELKILDQKTSQNLSIMLGSMKIPYEEIKRRILEMDDKLDLSLIEPLLKSLPEPDVLSQFTNLKEEYNNLTESEQFCVVMSGIKRLGPRLNSTAFKLKFEEIVQEIKPDIVTATEALEEVKSSKKFAGILQLILLMGNYMNAGSRNEQSVGFDLKYLTKLSDTKTADNKKTLLHFLSETVETSYSDLMNFPEELHHVHQASKVSDENIQKNLASMLKSVKQLETDMKNAEMDKSAPDNDHFVSVMKKFQSLAQEQCELLTEMSKKMSKLFDDTAVYFAFDSKKYSMEEFMGDIKVFIDGFVQATKDNMKIREVEEKARRAKELQEKKEKEKEEKLSRKNLICDLDAADDQEGVMDNLLEALKSGSAFNMNRKEGARRKRAAGAERRAQLVKSRSRNNIDDSGGGDDDDGKLTIVTGNKENVRNSPRHKQQHHPFKLSDKGLDELMASSFT